MQAAKIAASALIWMLFSGSNLTASANDLEWNGKKWSIVNHFIPYTEAEVNAPGRFESDFMVQYLAERGYPEIPQIPLLPPFSKGEAGSGNSSIPHFEKGGLGGISSEALAVLEAGKILWQAYFVLTDVRTMRDELKLNRPDVGWYQIRNALKARNASGDAAPVDFSPFENAYKALGGKLRPQVFELGFLR